MNSSRKAMPRSISKIVPFQLGSFRLSTDNGEGKIVQRGLYRLASDTIILVNPTLPVTLHEVAHRMFAADTGGFQFLRRMLGVSYSLIDYLIHTMYQHRLRLTVVNSNTWRVYGRSSNTDEANMILMRLKHVHGFLRVCQNALLVPAEMAAIDFVHGMKPERASKRRKDDLVVGFGRRDVVYAKAMMSWWQPQRINNTPTMYQWKNALIRDLGKSYPHDFGGYHLRYGSFENALYTAWEAYTTLAAEKPRTATSLIRFVMSGVIQAIQPERVRTDNISLETLGFFVHDTLNLIIQSATEALNMNVEGLSKDENDLGGEYIFAKAASEEIQETKQFADQIERLTLDGIPKKYQFPLWMVNTVEALVRAGLSDDRSQPLTSEKVENPDQSLYRFVVTPNGRYTVHLNKIFLEQVKTNYNFWGGPRLNDNWWRELQLLETMFTSFIADEVTPIYCPFQGWEGVSCGQQCPIRKTLTWLQEQSDLVERDGICQ